MPFATLRKPLSFLVTPLVAGSLFALVLPRASAAESASPGQPAGLSLAAPAILQNDRIRVEAAVENQALRERYLARADGGWVEVATAMGTPPLGASSLVGTTGSWTVANAQVSIGDNALLEELVVGEHRLRRRLTLLDRGPWIHVVTRFEPKGTITLRQFVDHFRFARRPDWAFSPSVGGFNPDAQYKAPLILGQAERLAFGIVPDLASFDRRLLQRCPHALDLDVPAGPALGVGFMPARMVQHCVYAADTNRSWAVEAPLENAYFLLVTAAAEPAQAYREAVRFHWENFGRPEQARAADQQRGTDVRYQSLGLWDDWRETVWQTESRNSWLAIPLPNGATGGGVRTERWGPGPSIYLSAWFNTMRTSYGMALYARRVGDQALLDLAAQTVALALQAPGRDGAFKCIAVRHDSGTIWAAGDGSGSSTKDGFLGYDMCWTAYWLLQWRAAGLPAGPALLERCRALARLMVARQRPDGCLPTRLDDNTAVLEEPSRTVKAETGPVALFLLALYEQDRNPDFLAAAKRGLAFLEREVVPQRQWYDYETFWSCSPRKPAFDQRSHQWPANNLALTQTVEAYLLAARITGEAGYLAIGEQLLDYLLLYQQCWTHPGLENLSSDAMLLGGFTTQNSDAEWSDARQSQCGHILLDYYRATGKGEYLERGIAALRAQFPISPSENWAHSGYGRKAGISSFHWGTGSGLAGIEIEADFLRDAIVDVALGRGVGVNGLNLTACAITGDQIQLRLSSPFAWKRAPVVRFEHAAAAKTYRVEVNGARAGSWQGTELAKGVPLPLAPTP